MKRPDPQSVEYAAYLYHDPEFFVEELWKAIGSDKKAPLNDVDREIIRWMFVGCTNPDGSIWTRQQILEASQTDAGLVPQWTRRGIIGTRGLGKTWLAVAADTAWTIYRDPNKIIGNFSKSTDHAKKTVKLVRRWLDDVPFLRHLAPAADQIDGALGFEVRGADSNREPSFRAQGIGGQIAGGRTHKLHGDDIETKEGVRTPEGRELLRDTATEFAMISSYGFGEILLEGTPHHPTESIYNHLANLRDENGKPVYKFYRCPIMLPLDDRYVIDDLLPIIAEKKRQYIAANGGRDVSKDIVPVFPQKPKMDLAGIVEKMAEGFYPFAMQCMVVSNMGDDDLFPLKLSDLIVPDYDISGREAPVEVKWGRTTGDGSTEWDPQELPNLVFTRDRMHKPIRSSREYGLFSAINMAIDPSGRGTDQTAYAIARSLGGKFWCSVGALPPRMGFEPEAMDRLVMVARENHVQRIFIEKYSMQGTFVPILQERVQAFSLAPGVDEAYPDGWSCSVEELPHTRAGLGKEEWICKVLEPAFNAHRVIIDAESLRPCEEKEAYELQVQITRMTPIRGALPHDDKIDALAQVISTMAADASVNPERAAQRARERAAEELIRRRAEKNNKTASQPTYFDHGW